MTELTAEEKRAIASLKRLAKKWPITLWLYSGSGSLTVMRKVNGKRAMTGASYDQSAIIEHVDIESDGGDF
jgi:hypothetical protein